jgi:hypothetical protein
MADSTPDYTYSTANDGKPVRTDNRTILHELHDAIGNAIGLGPNRQAVDPNVNAGGKREGLMDAVNDAVKNAPPPGSESN